MARTMTSASATTVTAAAADAALDPARKGARIGLAGAAFLFACATALVGTQWVRSYGDDDDVMPFPDVPKVVWPICTFAFLALTILSLIVIGRNWRRAARQGLGDSAKKRPLLAESDDDVEAGLGRHGGAKRGLATTRYGASGSAPSARDGIARTPSRGSSNSRSTAGGGGASSGSSAPVECGMCLETVPRSQMQAPLSCGHSACLTCMATYIQSGMDADKMTTQGLPCPSGRRDCAGHVDVGDTLACERAKALPAARRLRFVKLLQAKRDEALLRDNPLSGTRCPEVGCNHAFVLPRLKHAEMDACDCAPQGVGRLIACVACCGTADAVVRCPRGACARAFCGTCQRDPHPGISCVESRMRAGEESADEAYGKWRKSMAANIKACPGCGHDVIKAGGCSHMTCSRCHRAWCWWCRKDWGDHGQHSGCTGPR